MSGTLHVTASTVTGLADTFTQRQQVPSDLGGPLRHGAGAVRTGDPALDAETKELFEQYQALLDRVSEAFGYTAGELTHVADATQQFAAERATETRQLMATETGTAHG